MGTVPTGPASGWDPTAEATVLSVRSANHRHPRQGPEASVLAVLHFSHKDAAGHRDFD